MKKALLIFSALFALFCGQAQTTTTPGVTQITLGSYQFLAHFPKGFISTKPHNFFLGAPGDGEVAGPIAKDTLNGFFASWSGHPGIKDTTLLDSNLVLLWWNPNASSISPITTASVINAITTNYNVAHIAVTGLSLGAQTWTNYAYSDSNNFKKISAFFLFSPDPTQSPAYGGWKVQGSWFAKYGAYFYAACATQDPLGFYAPAIQEYDSIVAYHPALTPEFNSSSCACHSSGLWGPYYSKYWIDPLTGRNIYDQFMWEFPVVFTPIQTPTSVVVTPTPTAKRTILSVDVQINATSDTARITTYFSDSTSTVNVIP